MSDDEQISYHALPPGTRVMSSDGVVIGTVERVLDIPELDLFDGIVIETETGTRFIDRDQVDRITMSAVHCEVTADQASSLPPPDAPPTYKADPRQYRGSSMMDRLKRKFGRARWSRERDTNDPE